MVSTEVAVSFGELWSVTLNSTRYDPAFTVFPTVPDSAPAELSLRPDGSVVLPHTYGALPPEAFRVALWARPVWWWEGPRSRRRAARSG